MKITDKRHSGEFIVNEMRRLREEGIPEKDIAERLGFISIIEMRRWKNAYWTGSREVYRQWAKYLEKEGKRPQEIALIIGKNASTVRMLLDDELRAKIAEEA